MGTKISALPAVTTPAVADEFPINQAGTTKKITQAQLLKLRSFDAKAYGATGDGVTNDAAAIQSAMDAAGAAGGGFVDLYDGDFYLSTTSLEFKYSNIIVRGNGRGAVGYGGGYGTRIKYTGSSGAFRNSDVTTPSIRQYCGIENLWINHDGSSSGASGVRIEAMRSFHMDNVYISSNSSGAGTWYGLHFLADDSNDESYFGEFKKVDIALTGASGTQWCVAMLGPGPVNRHRFWGGIWEGNNANSLIIATTTTASDTNKFYGVGMQTHGATIIQLGGGGAGCNDNTFYGCDFELPSGSSTITFAAASGTAQRNGFVGCSLVNTVYSDPPAAQGNWIMAWDEYRSDAYQGDGVPRAIWLRAWHTGMEITDGIVRMGETGVTSTPAANFADIGVRDVAGVTQWFTKYSDGTIVPLAQADGLHVGGVKVFRLGAQHSISSATGTEVTGLGPCTLQAGTYTFTYTLLVRSSTAADGPMLGVNFTGTGNPRMHFRFADATTAVTAEVHSMDDQGNKAFGFISGMASSAKSTTAPDMGTTIGVATTATDILCFIEGIIIVTAVGDLELWHSSESTNATSVEVGSSLVVTRTA